MGDLPASRTMRDYTHKARTECSGYTRMGIDLRPTRSQTDVACLSILLQSQISACRWLQLPLVSQHTRLSCKFYQQLKLHCRWKLLFACHLGHPGIWILPPHVNVSFLWPDWPERVFLSAVFSSNEPTFTFKLPINLERLRSSLFFFINFGQICQE